MKAAPSSGDGKKKGVAVSDGASSKSPSATSTNKETIPNVTKATTITKGNVPATKDSSKELMDYVWLSIAGYLLYRVCITAYQIRLGAINEFGPVIHEFDPYFNYRATEYLYWNGAQRFFQWFDHKVWYPLGRPVGTTIYPGMQFTAVWIKNYLLPKMSLNDICCYIPAWFGVLTTLGTASIAYEVTIPTNTSSNIIHYLYQLFLLITTGNRLPDPTTSPSAAPSVTFLGLYSPALECAIAAGAMMTIVPAHLMRSIGGGYDNESVAVPAMVWTCYFWIRSLRNNDPYAYLVGIITGLSYFYMVASWGGYVFLLNLIGTHAAVLVLMGRFDTTTVYRAYTLFYVIGTSLAIQVPVVGFAPLKSLEQLGPCAVFLGYQLLFITETVITRKKGVWTRKQAYTFRAQVIGVAAVVAIIGASILLPTGYFGPLSARVRGLFVKHTKTGNPLVDSVAEHQPASGMAYFQYLHHVCTLAPIGFIIVLCRLSNSSSFLLIWGAAAYFFSHKMVRLILLTAPIGSTLAGLVVGRLLVWIFQQWWNSSDAPASSSSNTATINPISATVTPVQSSDDLTDDAVASAKGKGAKGAVGKKKKAGGGGGSSAYRSSKTEASSFDGLIALQDAVYSFSTTKEGWILRRVISVIAVLAIYVAGNAFASYCWRLQHDLSNPTIILKARRRDGVIIKVDDYREAYWWLRDNTPEDSRIMAWWDYGYQISAIANRTTIADGNTWNHEHIALLGKALTTDIDSGWEIARHLADYVLVWGGGGGDDLAKSPHLARIATSVYRDHCPDDPTCRAFGFVDRQLTPSTMMRRSLLYKLHSHELKPDVDIPEDKFTEVYRSMYGKVRIYKILGVSEESKKWVADPRNRRCDAHGSWFCPGQYPPGLNDILSRKMDFRQLEDFNRGDNKDSAYQAQYFRDLQDPEAARRKILEKEQQERLKAQQRGLSDDEKRKQKQQRDEIYNSWSDTEDTTTMWRLINTNDVEGLKAWLDADSNKAFIRSKDGRGPMWWSFEQRNEEITRILMEAGVPHTDVDAAGLSPLDLLERSKSKL